MELKEDPQEVSQLPVFLGNRQVLSRQPPVPREKTEKTKWACMVDTDSPSSGSGEPCPEPSPAHTAASERSLDEQFERNAEKMESYKAPRRPCFKKPTREARLRQLKQEVREFCALSFDEVDPFQQQGLTCRMLAFLKSLSRVLTWQEGEVRGEMPAYEMLAVPKVDMQMFNVVSSKADELIEKHRFRQAYELLCRMRPCFEPDEGAAGTVTQAESSPKKKVAEVVPSRPAVSAPQCQEIAPCPQSEAKAAVPEATSPAIHRGVPPSARLPSTSAGETKAKAAGRHEKSAAGQGGGKYLCRVKVGIEEDVTFQVCRRIIGPGGENMKRIIESTGNGSVKIRLRGRGSKYLEGPEHKESNDDLMLCVSATNRRSFEKAASLVEGLITSVQQDYVAFCQARRLPVPSLSVRREAQRSR